MSPEVLIKDEDFKRPLRDLGFCVCPLLNKEEIDRLKYLYTRLSNEGVPVDCMSPPGILDWKKQVDISDEIFKIINHTLHNSFSNYENFIAFFAVKKPGGRRDMSFSQDWNIVDEQYFASHQIWIPLEVTYPTNGGPFVLPLSHRFFKNYRSGSYGIPDVAVSNELKPLLADMILVPGQALVYHNSLFHGYYPNDTESSSIGVVVSLRQKNATAYYFHKNTVLNCTEKYALTSDSFFKAFPVLLKGERPENFINPVTEETNKLRNEAIRPAELLQCFNKAADEDVEDFEPTQLHILKDPELEKKLHRNGYVIFDLLDDKTVAEIKAEYMRSFDTHASETGRFTVMENSSPASKLQIHHFILEKVRDFLDNYFADYQTPIASYFTKYAQSTGGLSWHTDASLLLNTHLEPHYGIWCPLVDVNEQNGAFCLVERSHKFSHSVFCDGIDWPYTPYMADFDEKKKIIDLKAGQVVFFDLRLIHNAMPNNTNEDRICFCVRLTHQKTKYFSFNNKKGTSNIVNIFEEYPDFYLREEWSSDNQKYPLDKKLGEMHNIYSTIDHGRIEAALYGINADSLVSK